MSCLFCEIIDLDAAVEPVAQVVAEPTPPPKLKQVTHVIIVRDETHVTMSYSHAYREDGSVIAIDADTIVVKWPSSTSYYGYESPYTVVYEIIAIEEVYPGTNRMRVVQTIRWENSRRKK